MTQRTLTQVIIKNTLAVLTGGTVIRVLNALFAIASARLLGDVGLGQFATILAFVGVCSVFFELGLTQYVEREIARDASRVDALLGALIALRLILAVLGIVAITALASVVGYTDVLLLGTFTYTLTFLFAAVLAPLQVLLSANERYDLLTTVQVLGQFVSMLLGLGLLVSGYGFFALLLTGFVAMPLQIGLCLWMLHRYGLTPLRLRLAFQRWPMIIRAAIPFGIAALALNFNFNVDTVVLSWYRPSAEIGWYNVGYRLIFTLVGVLGAFLEVMTPSLTRVYHDNPAAGEQWIGGTLRLMALCALPASVGLFVLAEPIVALLYGQAFVAAAPVTALLAWDLPLLLFTAFCGNVSTAIGRERAAALIYGGSAALNLVLNLLLIPHFGIYGAALVTLITDGVSALAFAFVLRSALYPGRALKYLLGCGVAALLMGSIVWSVRDLTLWIAVMSGLFSYGVLALALRWLDRTGDPI
jgi:O-antigen/teichoic acid export membrane protein